MISLHPQFIVDDNQARQAVLISLQEWESIVDALEELDDIHAYDTAKSESTDAIPFEQAVREVGEDCS